MVVSGCGLEYLGKLEMSDAEYHLAGPGAYKLHWIKLLKEDVMVQVGFD